MKFDIYVRSYKRANGLLGKNYFKTAKYVIPESQKKEYLQVLKSEDRIITIPDEADGNLCRKSNWIMKNLSKPLIMIDDDIKHIEVVEDRVSQDQFIGFKAMTFDSFVEYAENVFDLCREWGIHYWGIAQKPDEREYKEWMPFSLTNIICGPFQAHLDHDLLYDERMPSKDDYDMSLQQLNDYRKILRINKLAYRCKHADNKGGIVGMRTMEYELENCRAIERKWGRNIIKYPMKPAKMTDLLNGVVSVPIRGV